MMLMHFRRYLGLKWGAIVVELQWNRRMMLTYFRRYLGLKWGAIVLELQ